MSSAHGNSTSTLKKRPTTPLRRISRGSLSQLALSQTRADPSAAPLDFLSPAFSELADSMSDLQTNFEHLGAIHDSIAGFNEAFASFLYGMKMNAFCVEFPEAPVAESFRRAEIQRQQTTSRHSAAFHNANLLDAGNNEYADTTFVTNDVSSISFEAAPPPAIKKAPVTKGPVKKKAAPPTQLKQLQKKVIDSLPVKYRDLGPHRNAMETIIKALKENPEGLYYPDILNLTSVPRTQCTQYMNALVSSKHVSKTNQKGLIYKLETQ